MVTLPGDQHTPRARSEAATDELEHDHSEDAGAFPAAFFQEDSSAVVQKSLVPVELVTRVLVALVVLFVLVIQVVLVVLVVPVRLVLLEQPVVLFAIFFKQKILITSTYRFILFPGVPRAWVPRVPWRQFPEGSESL